MMENPILLEMHQDLGIQANFTEGRELKVYEEAPLSELMVSEIDFYGRPLCLTKKTHQAWRELLTKAKEEKITINAFSGFRSYLYQKIMIEDRLKQGRELDEILTNVAAPGFSEHHTGCAIDLTTQNSEPLTEKFEETKAFEWLQKNAQDFGFILSFPRGNPQGYIYEPWHWCFQG